LAFDLLKVTEKFGLQVDLFIAQNVHKHLLNLKNDDLVTTGGQTFPIKISHAVLSPKEVTKLVNFLLVDKSNLNLCNLPLLLTEDMFLRRFDDKAELYPHEWSHLLPSKKHLFVHYGYSHMLSSKLKDFNADVLMKYLPDEKIKDSSMTSLNLLQFIAKTYDSKKHGSKSQYLAKFGNIKLLPAWSRLKGNYFDSFSSFNNLLRSSMGGVSNILELAGASVLNIEQLFKKDDKLKDDLWSFFHDCCTNGSNAEEVLSWVIRNKEENRTLDQMLRKNKESISSRLQDLFTQLSSRSELHSTLQLPIFFTSNGICSSVTELKEKGFDCVYCLRCSINTENLPIAILTTKNNSSFIKKLGFEELNVSQTYRRYIVQHFSQMTNKAQLCHLEVVRRYVGELGYQDLLNHLKRLKFVRNEDQVHCYIPDLILASSEFQKKVAQKSKLINNDYSQKANEDFSFKSFLIELGIKTNLDEEDVLSYIDENFVNRRPWEKVTKIEEFMKHLLNEKVFKEVNFLKKLSTKRFLPRFFPTWAKSILPFDPEEPISFAGSVEYDGSSFVWFVMPCLHKSFPFPIYKEDKEFFNKELDIITTNSLKENHLEKIVENFKKLCLKINANKNLSEAYNRYDYSKALQVLSSFKTEDLGFMASVPCIYLGEGTFSRPNMTCQNVNENFQPYLRKFPIKLGVHWELFQRFGCSVEPGVKHYQNVLRAIAEETRSDVVTDPNIVKIAKEAYNEFLKLLQKDSELNGDILFLPTEDLTTESLRVRLLESTELVINDWPEMTKAARNYSFVLRTEYTHNLSLLPAQIAPRKLTDLFDLKVNLDESVKCSEDNCFSSLLTNIHSDKFCESLIRLIMYYENKQYNLPRLDKNSFDSLLYTLRKISIVCYKSLKIDLVDKKSGKELNADNESFKSVLIDNSHKIATPHANSTSAQALESILIVFYDILMKHFNESCQWEVLSHNILKLFVGTPSTMREILDQQNIDQIEDLTPRTFDLIGRCIPSDLISILLDDPYLPVKVGKIVAYRDDESGAFLFAEIKEIHGEVSPATFVSIDVKDKMLKVRILDIFFFDQTFRNLCKEVAIYERNEDEEVDEDDDVFGEKNDCFGKNISDIKAEITRQLEEQFKNLKDDKKAWQKFVRRLIFKWHPDKNPGNEEIATEATKFIQNEVERIENGRSTFNNNGFGGSGGFHGFDARFWEDLFRHFDQEARYQRSRRESYERNYRDYHRSGGSNSYSRYNVPPSFDKNNIDGAWKWLKESKENLLAANDNMSRDHCDVAAYFYRMAIERAVKSAELCCSPTSSMSHNIGSIISGLPGDIGDQLMDAWIRVPSIIHNYSEIMYRGMNQNLGSDRPTIFFKKHKDNLSSCRDIAEKMIQICEDFLYTK